METQLETKFMNLFPTYGVEEKEKKKRDKPWRNRK